MAVIKLDYREHGLLEVIPSAIRENLLVGDIHIQYKERNFILERKTIADLLSSIKDGRYKEQKIRLVSYMKDNLSKRRIAYILEGDVYAPSNALYSESDKNVVLGFLVSTTMRDNIPVFISKDRYTTRSIIEKLVARLMKEPADFFKKTDTLGYTPQQDMSGGDASEDSYASVIKMHKKENLTPLVWWLLSLSQIPGVSHSIAEMIVMTYPTIESLFQQYKNPELSIKNKELLLSEIRISKLENARKIGKIVSTRIYNYIMSVQQIPADSAIIADTSNL